MKNKMLYKLLAFSSLMTGCVAQSPVAHETEITVKEGNIPQKKKVVYYGSEKQYTYLGNAWNMGTYGALGTLWGIPCGWNEGFNNTNATSTLTKSIYGTTGALIGPFSGLYRGMDYGVHLDYQKGRPVEEHLLNATDYLYKKMKDYTR